MNDTDFDNTIKKLQEQVSQFSGGDTEFEIPKNTILSKINFKTNLVYFGLIPLFIMIILYILKPYFVMTETIIDETSSLIIPKKLSFKKLFLSTVICTCIISIIIFSYLYTKNKST